MALYRWQNSDLSRDRGTRCPSHPSSTEMDVPLLTLDDFATGSKSVGLWIRTMGIFSELNTPDSTELSIGTSQ